MSVERLIGSIRRECLDHVLVVGEAHLRRTLKTYAAYYNQVWTHLSLSKDAPNFRRSRTLGSIVAMPHKVPSKHIERVEIYETPYKPRADVIDMALKAIKSKPAKTVHAKDDLVYMVMIDGDLAEPETHEDEDGSALLSDCRYSERWDRDCVAEQKGFEPAAPRSVVVGKLSRTLAQYLAKRGAAVLERISSLKIRLLIYEPRCAFNSV